jgi:hypothetical protein
MLHRRELGEKGFEPEKEHGNLKAMTQDPV